MSYCESNTVVDDFGEFSHSCGLHFLKNGIFLEYVLNKGSDTKSVWKTMSPVPSPLSWNSLIHTEIRCHSGLPATPRGLHPSHCAGCHLPGPTPFLQAHWVLEQGCLASVRAFGCHGLAHVQTPPQ